MKIKIDSSDAKTWITVDKFLATDGKYYRLLPCGRIIRIRRPK